MDHPPQQQEDWVLLDNDNDNEKESWVNLESPPVDNPVIIEKGSQPKSDIKKQNSRRDIDAANRWPLQTAWKAEQQKKNKEIQQSMQRAKGIPPYPLPESFCPCGTCSRRVIIHKPNGDEQTQET